MIRGTIYVIRSVAGEDRVLSLVDQAAYREWIGCWSAI